MPLYSYTAVSQKGEEVLGQETVKDEKDLARILREKGLVLTSAKMRQARQSLGSLSILNNIFGVSLTEKLMFIRNLKVMVSAGVSLPRALDVLSEQAGNGMFKKALAQMKEKIVQGNMFSQAMAEYPQIFSELFVNMVKVGEESGTLENVLGQLNLQLEKQHELRSKIMGALTYPIVIVVAMTVIGILMIVLVVPNLAKTFQDLGAELPLTTRFVIGLGNFLINQWYIALGGFAVLVIGLWRALRTKIGKSIADNLVLKTPILKGIVQKTSSAVTLRTLSSLIGSGVPIVRSLEITSSVLGNTNYRQALEKSAEDMKKGAKLSDTLRPYKKLYPPLVIQMMEVGEETGQTSEVLGKLAEFYEEEVGQVTQNFASIIEPVLMLLIGSAVGFFAVSMIQPMYSILGSVK